MKLYRPGVGIVLLNKKGEVLAGKRARVSKLIKQNSGWQMPQGGIQSGESPICAMWREMQEEIGTQNAKVLKGAERWMFYDFPKAIKISGKYMGQKQKWFLLEFLGEDCDININFVKKPEFSEWKWIDIKDLIDLAVDFKKNLYIKIEKEFF